MDEHEMKISTTATSDTDDHHVEIRNPAASGKTDITGSMDVNSNTGTKQVTISE